MLMYCFNVDFILRTTPILYHVRLEDLMARLSDGTVIFITYFTKLSSMRCKRASWYYQLGKYDFPYLYFYCVYFPF